MRLQLKDVNWTPKPGNAAFGLRVDSTELGLHVLVRARLSSLLFWASGDDNKLFLHIGCPPSRRSGGRMFSAIEWIFAHAQHARPIRWAYTDVKNVSLLKRITGTGH